MKDFDFDELDRAVNSVLATKDAKNTQQDQTVDSQPQDAASTQTPGNDQADSSTAVPVVDTSNAVPVADEDEVSAIPVTVSGSDAEPQEEHEDSPEQQDTPSEPAEPTGPEESEEPSEEPVETQDDTSPEPEAEATETPAPSVSDAAPLSAISVKRGRFMDMVAPGSSSDTTKKPLGSRSGVTITPSADFAATASEQSEQHETPAVNASVDPATPIVEGEVEPEVSAEGTSVSGDAHEEDVADSAVEVTVEPMSATPVTPSNPADTTPFIPDVPVEKRPLNDLSDKEGSNDDSSASTGEETPVQTADPTLSANVPKEFDKDIMAVEANETVGEKDETHPADETTPEPVQPAASDADTTSPALAATTAEPHPMFDTSTLAHPGDLATHHTSKLSWAIVAISLFIVGAALGVLYFLYGQG